MKSVSALDSTQHDSPRCGGKEGEPLQDSQEVFDFVRHGQRGHLLLEVAAPQR